MKMLPQRRRLGNLTCQQDRAAFTEADPRSIFPERSKGTFTSGLTRLVAPGGAEARCTRRQCLSATPPPPSHTGMDRAGAATGDTSCLSLETALGGYSSTSRLTRCITVMTTCRMGRSHTPFGTVAFSHDDRIAAEVRAGTVDSGRPPQEGEPRAVREWLPKCYVAEIPEMPLSNLTLLNHPNMKMTATFESIPEIDNPDALGHSARDATWNTRIRDLPSRKRYCKCCREREKMLRTISVSTRSGAGPIRDNPATQRRIILQPKNGVTIHCARTDAQAG